MAYFELVERPDVKFGEEIIEAIEDIK